MKGLAAAVLLWGVLVSCPRFAAADADETAALPDWLSVHGSVRLRYEAMDNTFRRIDPGFDELVVSRISLAAIATGERFYGGVEILDSRAWLHQPESPINTGAVNTLAVLKASIGYTTPDAFLPGDNLDLEVGRFDLDVNNKRFVARNNFRNTINAFTGVRATWSHADVATIHGFYTLPVARLPNNTDRPALLDNEYEADEQSTDVVFWGLAVDDVRLNNVTTLAAWLFGVKESDTDNVPSRDRDFVTAALRLGAVFDRWAFGFDGAYQHGQSRLTALPTDTVDLDHRAWSVHVHANRILDALGNHTVTLAYDYATGDEDPNDMEHNRLDMLYGVRRFEYGPLGNYGPFGWRNISSPAVAYDWKFGDSGDFEIAYRAAWLASDRDAQVYALLRDPDGRSGSFVGQQIDSRVRWVLPPADILIDIGAAYLIKGEFLKSAPGAPDDANTIYGYVALQLDF